MENLSITQIIDRLEANSIYIDEYTEDGKLCGYEMNTYTDGGVNQIVFIDFRNTDMNPKSGKDFLTIYNDRINDIDIDDEIEMNRQDKSYCANFTIQQSLTDFTGWKDRLQNIFSGKTEDKKLNLRIANSRGKKPVINQIKKARTLLQDLQIEINDCEGRDKLNEITKTLWDILEDNA